MKKKSETLDKEIVTHNEQLETLKKLELQLQKQIEEWFNQKICIIIRYKFRVLVVFCW